MTVVENVYCDYKNRTNLSDFMLQLQCKSNDTVLLQKQATILKDKQTQTNRRKRTPPHL